MKQPLDLPINKAMKKLIVTAILSAFSLVAFSAGDVPRLRENNADSIVALMTTEEKARLVTGRNDYTFGGYDNPDEFVRVLAPSVSGYTQGIPRLGIPPTALADGPAGVVVVTRPDNKKNYYATGFPTGSSLASSWNEALVREVGEAMGTEAREYGVDVILGPGMNIMRSPLCGRNYEYFSEDPVLTGKIASAFVKGVQGAGVGATLKHYAVNSQETNRTEVDEVVAPRSLREIYLKGFEIAVKESHPWTVMASYNRLNGPYTQENHDLLTTILRGEWGFEGMVMTDWIQKRDTGRQIKAGIDNLQPGYQDQYEDILALVESGELPMADLDRAAARMLRYIMKTPHFRGYAYSDSVDYKKGAAVSRAAAAEGIVLLKNAARTLPIDTAVKSLALFGYHSFDFMAGGTGSGNVVKPYVVNLYDGLSQAGYKMDDGLGKLYEGYRKYIRAKNRCERDPEERWYVEPPVTDPGLSWKTIELQARNADMAVITIGRQAGEGRDRGVASDFNLTQEERSLIEDVSDAFHAAGKKVVVLLNIGGPVETASWKGLADAIAIVWQPGQEGGNAVADVLTGKVNPSGRLTMTFPVAYSDVPSSLNFPAADRRTDSRGRGERRNVDYTLHAEGLDIGYRYFSTAGHEVSYPFGYGLSYTEFEYDRPMVKAAGDGFEASVTVKNTGSVPGKEVVQLYVTAPAGDLTKPALELKSFGKTRLLQPGESQRMVMKVKDYDLASFDEARSSWVSAPGEYDVKFAASADDVRAHGSYRLKSEKSWKVNDVLHPDRNLLSGEKINEEKK